MLNGNNTAPLRDRLGDLLNRGRWFDLLSVGVVLAPGLALLLLVTLGQLDGGSGLSEVLAWSEIVVSLLLVWLVLWVRQDGPGSIGLRRPTSWWRTFLMALGVAFVAMILGQLAQQFLVAPLTGGETADVSRFDRVRGNFPMLVVNLLGVWLNSAFGEEVIWRGFLLTRLAHIFGGGRTAWTASVIASSLLFGSIHMYQGAAGVVVTGVVGLVFSIAFIALRRNLWILIIAHGLIHLVSFTALYLDLV